MVSRDLYPTSHFLPLTDYLLLVVSVRQKAKEIISFIQDDERLKEARKQAKQSRDKYVGYSSEEAQYKYSQSFPPA